MSNSRYTDLPAVSNANLTDITCAVQGYTSSSSLGTSTQQTWAQVQSLFLSNTILYNAGNPNAAIAGTTYQFCWDTMNEQLYICTSSGTSSTAEWTIIQTTTPTQNFFTVMGTSQQMEGNAIYRPNNASLVTLTLPLLGAAGQTIDVLGNGSGGWKIALNAGQNIQVGSSSSTVGVGGSVASTNQYDSISLICVVANTTWQTISGPQGDLTIT